MQEKMKNTFRRLLSIVAAIAMVIGIVGGNAVPAMAADENVTNETDHTYSAYQIFNGTQQTGSTALGDITWGNGINGPAFLAALKATTETRFNADGKNIFADATTAQDVANVLAANNANSTITSAFAEIASKNIQNDKGTIIPANTTTTTLSTGYYVIVDNTATLGEGDAYNPALLQITNSNNGIKIQKKYNTPSLDKAIVTSDNPTSNDGSDATSKSIGDTIYYRLTGTLPSNFADYETYTYKFHDTLSKGQAYQNDLKVYVKNAGSDAVDVTSYFTNSLTGKTDGSAATIFSVASQNIKGINNVTIDKDSKIIVTYSAVLTSEASIGNAGNTNEAYLEYSNDPNDQGEGKTGNTPTDKTVVFTFDLDTTKVDASDTNKKLQGAQFILKAVEGEHEGKYVKVSDGKVTGWGDLAEQVITQAKEQSSEIESNYVLTSDASGKFEIGGLNAGKYQLIEIKAPAGYNLPTNPVEFEISATIDSNENEPTTGSRLTGLNIKVDNKDATSGNIDTGVVELQIQNNAGSTLPSTGGIGTTVFYVLGGCLIAAAAVVLITRKKRNA